METKNIITTCKECGEAFEMSAAEAAWYEDHNYALPKRCKKCRAARKAARLAKEKKQ